MFFPRFIPNHRTALRISSTLENVVSCVSEWGFRSCRSPNHYSATFEAVTGLSDFLLGAVLKGKPKLPLTEENVENLGLDKTLRQKQLMCYQTEVTEYMG